MKRQQDRDISPKSKRSRGGYSDHDERGRDIYELENERRDVRGRDLKPSRGQGRDVRDLDREFDSGYGRPQRRYRDSLDRGSDRNDSYVRDNGRERSSRQAVPSGTQDYRTLCISNLNPDVHDSHVRDILNDEFYKFGDFNVKVVHQGDFRIAYVNFRYPSDAHAAKEALPTLTLFDMPVRIDPVYQTYNKRQRSRSPDGRQSQRDIYASRDPRELSPTLSLERRGGIRQAVAREPPTRDRMYQEERRHQSGEREPKEHKFPHHLDHIEPEYDDKATRTLFVGSLDHDVADDDLRQVFEKYGVVEDVDIKRKNQGNPYAFVRFLNLDMAHRAKVEMSGHYIGNSQCKIGYGKVNPTCCLWIGGLGPWIIPEELIRLFDRFGPIQRMEWPAAKKYAYILYDDMEAAKSASTEMRGYPLAGPDRRLRVDYADPAHMDMRLEDVPDYRGVPSYEIETSRRRDPGPDQYARGYNNSRSSNRSDWPAPERREPGRSSDRTRELNHDRYRYEDAEPMDRRPRRNSFEDDRDRGYRTRVQQDRSPPPRDRNHDRNQGSYSPPPRRRFSPPTRNGRGYASERDRSDSDRHDRPGRQEGSSLPMGDLKQVETISDLASCLPVVWSGALVLKNSAFTTKMHLLSGDVHLVDTLMRDPSTTESPMLRITQRLRLDQPKLQEVHRRVSQSGGHSVLLAMPGSAYDDPNASVQQRPLKNLVSYLKQKDAAGVISLPPYPPPDRDNVGVLHAFPSCEFSQDFLSQKAPRLDWTSSKEDFLVIVVVRGSAISA